MNAGSRLVTPKMSVAFSPSAGGAINEGDRSADLEDCFAIAWVDRSAPKTMGRDRWPARRRGGIGVEVASASRWHRRRGGIGVEVASASRWMTLPSLSYHDDS